MEQGNEEGGEKVEEEKGEGEKKVEKKEKSTEAVFSDGIVSVLNPLFKEYDVRMKTIQLSQSEMADRISKLNESLSKCKRETELINVKPYLSRLTGCKKTVQHVSSTLLRISDRLNRLNKLAKQKYPELFLGYQKQQKLKNEKLKKKEQEKKEAEQKEEDRKEEGKKNATVVVPTKESTEVEEIKEDAEEEKTTLVDRTATKKEESKTLDVNSNE